jgi:EAL domain-containing protein (putative c-di-GMP-specific phosphodiesterase class I)
MDLRSGQIAGVEALLRWQHPTRGILDAEQFMPFAEQSGLVSRISDAAIESAIRQCGEWRRLGLDVAVAVNTDMRSLVDLDFPGRVAASLQEHDVDPSQIELEIAETSLMRDPARLRRVADELAAIGVELAIDDFGTGYSSLSSLSRLPLSRLKIDQSFVTAMRDSTADRVIVRATIELAHGLGLETVAEGIEHAETLELLRELGCDLGQGFHIGVPAPASSFVGVTSDWAAA